MGIEPKLQCGYVVDVLGIGLVGRSKTVQNRFGLEIKMREIVMRGELKLSAPRRRRNPCPKHGKPLFYRHPIAPCPSYFVDPAKQLSPGTTKLSRLDENNGSLAIKLTSNDLREIDSAASKITVQGDRYPEHLLRMSGR
jgi:hypothetical protein